MVQLKLLAIAGLLLVTTGVRANQEPTSPMTICVGLVSQTQEHQRVLEVDGATLEMLKAEYSEKNGWRLCGKSIVIW